MRGWEVTRGWAKWTILISGLAISGEVANFLSYPRILPHDTTLLRFETFESMGIPLPHPSCNRVTMAIATSETIAPDAASWPNVFRRAYKVLPCRKVTRLD